MSKINEKEYVNCCINLIIKFKYDLKTKIFQIRDNDKDPKIKLKQIFIFREGMLDIIIRTLKSIDNEFVLDSIGANKVQSLKNELLGLFDILTYENPFLIMLCFTNEFSEFILKHISRIELNFYIDKLKIIKKFGYKLNLERFVSILNEKVADYRNVYNIINNSGWEI